MPVRMADTSDIELLVKARFDYFATEDMQLTPGKKSMIESQLRSYYALHLNHDCYAALVEDEGGGLQSMAVLVLSEKPANPSFPTGKTGLILNVFTYPEYRNKGFATQAMQVLIDEARRQNASYLELSASEMGIPLYKKLGFQVPPMSPFIHMKLYFET